MTSKLNVIINPVRRWFSFDKPIVEEKPMKPSYFYMVDEKGNLNVFEGGFTAYIEPRAMRLVI